MDHIASPSGDVNMSSNSTDNGSTSNAFVGQPVGDMNYTDSGNRNTQEHNFAAQGLGIHPGDGTRPDDSTHQYHSQEERLNIYRPLHEFHLQKVVSSHHLSKDLIRNLKTAAEFTDQEQRLLKRNGSEQRNHECMKVLNLWHRRTEAERTVNDLRILLTNTGFIAGNSNKYNDLIQDIVNNPP